MTQKYSTLAALLLVCAIGIFYAATIREGHVWGDDQAAYMNHARNIVDGKAYGETGYIRSPTSINPKMYPPGFPLLLAPTYYFFGLNLTPMKAVGIFFFCGALLMFYFLARDSGSESTALTTVAVIGLCPYFWDFKDTICSEFPFLAFAYAGLLVSQRAMAGDGVRGKRILFGIAAGLLGGLAYGVRSVGIVLVPVILLAEVARVRKFTCFGLSFAATFVLFAISEKLLFRLDSDYLSPYLRIFSVKALLGGMYHYLFSLSVMWENGYSTALQILLYLVLCVLAVCGAIVRARKGEWGILDVFGAGYLAFILLFPWGGRRYLMPIMPVFVFYVVSALKFLSSRRPSVRRPMLQIGLALAIGLCFAARYTSANWREIPGGIQSRDARDLVEFVRQRAGGKEVVVFRKARFMSLYAETRSADVIEEHDCEKALTFYRQVGASLFVTSRLFNDEAERSLSTLISERWQMFDKIYDNGSFSVYAAKSRS